MTFAPEKGTKLEEREEEPPNKWSGQGGAHAPGRALSKRRWQGRRAPLSPKEVGEPCTGSSWWPAKMSQATSAGLNTTYPLDRSALSKEGEWPKKQLCTESTSVFTVKRKDPGVNNPLPPGSPDQLGCPLKQLGIYFSDHFALAGLASGEPCTWGTQGGAALYARRSGGPARSTPGLFMSVS